MAIYGDNEGAQIKAFGNINTSLNSKTEEARKTATVAINSKLNVKEIQDPSDAIHVIANELAAGVLSTKPGENPAESTNWQLGMQLLEDWRGDDSGDAKWRINIPVERFRGIHVLDRPHSFVD